MIRSLPPAELRRFAEWWETHRRSLLEKSAPNDPPAESDAVKAELLRRRQEYDTHPERFVQMNDAALDQMFRDIENEAS
jgi:hypothetical protein